MTDASTDLECNIEASRARLDGTLDTLRGRLNPSGLVEDMLATARGSEIGAGLYDGVLDAVRRSPVPVLLICLGAVLLLGTRARPVR